MPPNTKRICAGAPTSETEISLGVYANYHCDRRPAPGQNANLGKIRRASTPEDCIKECVKMVDCDQVAWLSGKYAGCYAARAIGIDKYPGGLIITYRLCKKQAQPTIEQLKLKEKALETERDQCLLDKKTLNTTLSTCQDDLKTCQADSAADSDADADGANNTDDTDSDGSDTGEDKEPVLKMDGYPKTCKSPPQPPVPVSKL
jgi:hypothetical protein